MSQEQIIDFTRNDLGLWLFFAISSVVVLASLKRTDLSGGWWWAGYVILRQVILGALIISPLVLFLAVWQRTPPHYFIQMKIADDQLTLGFRWPKNDVIIPISHVTNVSYWERRSLRRSFKRVQIDTASETFRSFGYNQIEDEDYRAIEQFRNRIPPSKTIPSADAQPSALP